ncbi:MAG: PD40 domain-containing protein [Acidobacteria bacterium]|nr:PD40 domain-containing protein [Acidobacteriota bacterium]
MIAFLLLSTAALAQGLDPAVSADGRWIAFASTGESSRQFHIWIRPLEGGNARQITSGSHDDSQPAFSPDGRMVAYRSEAGGGGIYVVPTAGGKPRLLAAGGRRPRYSPDGTRIAYTSANALFLRDMKSARSQPVHAGFRSAKDPVWSPDGKHLLFAGCKDASEESCDWWVSPASGGEPVATHAAAHFRQLHMESLPIPGTWQPTANTILFTARVGENTRLWSLPLSPTKWNATAAPRRLTTADKDERTPASTPGGRIVYASRSANIDVYTLPLHADAAATKGALTRITTDPSLDQRPSLSRDGKRIAWETSRGGNFEVWVKDLISGAEKGLTSGPLREHMPALSPDGASLVYDAHDGEKVTVFRSAFSGGEPVKIHEENVGQGSFQWTSQADSVLYFHREPPGTVGLMNLSTKQRTVLLRHPKLNLSIADARLSPDGRWIVFPVPYAAHRSRLAVAPVSTTVVDSESQWTYLLPDTFNSSQPEWSPNGKWIYFLSDQSGTLGVWALPMTTEGKPAGPSKQILALTGPRLSIHELRPRDIGLSIAADKLALAVAEYSGTLLTCAVATAVSESSPSPCQSK